MSKFFRVLSLAVVTFSTGCGSEMAKRTTFETLQNVRQQECLKNPSSSACDKRDSYDDYQRQRKELDPPK